MSAASKTTPPSHRLAQLLAALLLASSPAWAQPPGSLPARLAEIREVNRYVPERALPMLEAIEAEARRAGGADQAGMLAEMCTAHTWAGVAEKALAYCDELIAFGRGTRDKDAEARGLLLKANLMYVQNDLPASHRLVQEAEGVGQATRDAGLRFQLGVASAEAHGERGDFPRALAGLQTGLSFVREHGTVAHQVLALEALAKLYTKMNDVDRGFAMLDEALALAGKDISAGRLALLKLDEYGLAISAGQLPRALAAQLQALALQRRIGALSAIPYSLVNLSDCYLKMRDYRNAVIYGRQALAAARQAQDEILLAAALMNIGQAEIASGQLADGKRRFESGLAIYEKGGDKAEIHAVLLEYGGSLERAHDAAGAIKAYHRARAISNELYEKRRQKALLELEEKYVADRKGRQIAQLQIENRAKSGELDHHRLQHRIWWLLALSFALVAIVVGLLYRKVRKVNARLYEKNRELQQQSARDPLTGLFNRRHFHEHMGSTPVRVEPDRRRSRAEDGQPVGALFLMDVDHFKHINDRWGHGAGDAVLVQIAASLRDILRETGMIMRWGGEEFLAFLPNAPEDGLDEVARRLLAGIANTGIVHGETTLSATISIGYVPYPLTHGGQSLGWERALNLADMALYTAKSHGRNRAHGLRRFAGTVPLEEIEQNLEQAWRQGDVEMDVVTAGSPQGMTPTPPSAPELESRDPLAAPCQA